MVDDFEDVGSDGEVEESKELCSDEHIPKGTLCVEGNLHFTLARLVSRQPPSVQAKFQKSR